MTAKSFRRFLIDSPLIPVAAEDCPEGGAPPCGFGSFHQQYWIDGRQLFHRAVLLTSPSKIRFKIDCCTAPPQQKQFHLVLGNIWACERSYLSTLDRFCLHANGCPKMRQTLHLYHHTYRFSEAVIWPWQTAHFAHTSIHGWNCAGVLVAVGVVDVLPACLSSKYFFWDPDLAPLALGKVSAMKEIQWVAAASLHCPSLKHYYMGYYIHVRETISCLPSSHC